MVLLITTSIINELRTCLPPPLSVKQVWLADDAVGAGTLHSLKTWYDNLVEIGKRYGYHVNGSKCWLIVKSPDAKTEAEKVFQNKVKITYEGKRHLGAVIGSESYKNEYCNDIVNGWVKELSTLCEIAEVQPQAAYTVFTKGYKSKFTYFLRTINGFEKYVEPVDSLINSKFIPAIFGLDTPLEQFYRSIISQPTSDGGLGLNILAEEATLQHQSSLLVTKIHVNSIIDQDLEMKSDDSHGNTLADLKSMDRVKKNEVRKNSLITAMSVLPIETKIVVEQATEKGASSWLNPILIAEEDLDLNKEEFCDALRLRYNIPLSNLPSFCACGDRFDANYALCCKKGGFISRRHDNLRDLFTILLNKVCIDVESEPHLLPVTKEKMMLKTANIEEGARLDIKANGFWRRGQSAFYDIRITHVNSKSNYGKTTSAIFHQHEQSKKREYLQRVLEVEHACFTPLVFGTNGRDRKRMSALHYRTSFKTSTQAK